MPLQAKCEPNAPEVSWTYAEFQTPECETIQKWVFGAKLDPEFFDEKDADTSGGLSYEEIFAEPDTMKNEFEDTEIFDEGKL